MTYVKMLQLDSEQLPYRAFYSEASRNWELIAVTRIIRNIGKLLKLGPVPKKTEHKLWAFEQEFGGFPPPGYCAKCKEGVYLQKFDRAIYKEEGTIVGSCMVCGTLGIAFCAGCNPPGGHGPSHITSPYCSSGKIPHCSCSTCF